MCTQCSHARSHSDVDSRPQHVRPTCVMPRVALASNAVVQPVADRPYLQRLRSDSAEYPGRVPCLMRRMRARRKEYCQTTGSVCARCSAARRIPHDAHAPTCTQAHEHAQTRKHAHTRTHESTLTPLHKRARVTLQPLPYSVHYALNCGLHSTVLALSTGRALYNHLYYSNHHYRGR